MIRKTLQERVDSNVKQVDEQVDSNVNRQTHLDLVLFFLNIPTWDDGAWPGIPKVLSSRPPVDCRKE